MNMITAKTIVLLVIIFMLFTGATFSERIAIYNDTGAWGDGITAMKNMLDWIGYEYGEVNSIQLNYPQTNPLTGYDAIWFPGGWAYNYKLDINSTGVTRIRDLVSNGGVYLGTCAGSYYACKYIVWDNVTYDYPLDLFDGYAVGPELFPWPEYGVVTIDMNLSHPVNYTGKSSEDILLYGGGTLHPNAGVAIDVIGTYHHNGENAIISAAYGKGKVILTAVHPEIEEDSDRDGVNFENNEDTLSDNGSDWDFTKRLLDWAFSKPLSVDNWMLY